MKSSRRKFDRFSPMLLFTAVGNILIVGFLLALILSVFASGIGYQFDIDEFFFSQYAYLYTQGLKPYVDVYSSVYSPLFAWFITPVFWLKGFSFDGLHAARILMIVLLFIRMTALWHTVNIIFSKRAATLSLFYFYLTRLQCSQQCRFVRTISC